MEESPPKRRRTSPRTSQPIPQASTPGRDQTAPTQRNQRPSFASPTKASISRYNPQILERRRSTSPSKSSPARPSRRRRSNAGSEHDIQGLLAAQLESDAASVPASELSRGLADSHGPDSAAPSSSLAVPRAGGSMSAAPRRSPSKPSPRPLPPPAPEGEDDLNPFIGHTLRRSPTTGVNIPPRPEPELPPSVPDPVSSTPPRGIHTSSPSRWRGKSKVVGESPLKQPPLRPDDEEEENTEPAAKRLFTSRSNKSNIRAESVLGQVSNNPRRVVPYDPNLKKRKRVEKLREQIRKLESDLQVVGSENDRIRAAQGAGRSLGLMNESSTIQTLERHLIPGGDMVKPRQSELLARAAFNPTSLLAYTKPGPVVAPVPTEQDITEGIKSHYPVQMTAEKELPYLQLFGAFDVTSTVAIMDPTPEGTLRQRHLISLASRHAPGFFSAKIEMIVNATNLTILDLRIMSLEPAAKAELGEFLDRICSGDCNRSMQRNIGIVSWAMGDWLRIALQRATLWAQLDHDTQGKSGLSKLAAAARQRSVTSSGGYDGEADTAKYDLLRFLGRQCYDIEIPSEDGDGSTLRIQWKISSDWTGEAESTVDLAVGAPGKWHDIDTQGSLGKLPKLFRDLVGGGEATGVAVGAVAALLTERA
ncbi:hypothetical protein LIA77_00620 [Sarocladium implicatum]|nr:hypothetical protein LIA77_00620 [Sarocladium implicatum]